MSSGATQSRRGKKALFGIGFIGVALAALCCFVPVAMLGGLGSLAAWLCGYESVAVAGLLLAILALWKGGVFHGNERS